ncbi:MAG: type II toxin-antitoxin system HicB family antitoxin [Caldilineaceae bacterium]
MLKILILKVTPVLVSSWCEPTMNGPTMMESKGYIGSVQFDDDADIFHGEVINIRDVVTFQGTSVQEIRKAFQDSVDDYLEFCAERGEEPERPFSGKFTVRVSPEPVSKSICPGQIARHELEWLINEVLTESLQGDSFNRFQVVPRSGYSSMPNSEKVLVAILNNLRDFRIAQHQYWYRITSSAEKWLGKHWPPRLIHLMTWPNSGCSMMFRRSETTEASYRAPFTTIGSSPP